jgi:Mg/Co/Ni transporter MgtE
MARVDYSVSFDLKPGSTRSTLSATVSFMMRTVSRDDMIRALRERGPEAPVTEVLRSDIPVLHHRLPLEDALRLMQSGRLPAIGVTNSQSHLVGLVTPENIAEMMILAASPKRSARMPWQRISPG